MCGCPCPVGGARGARGVAGSEPDWVQPVRRGKVAHPGRRWLIYHREGSQVFAQKTIHRFFCPMLWLHGPERRRGADQETTTHRMDSGSTKQKNLLSQNYEPRNLPWCRFEGCMDFLAWQPQSRPRFHLIRGERCVPCLSEIMPDPTKKIPQDFVQTRTIEKRCQGKFTIGRKHVKFVSVVLIDIFLRRGRATPCSTVIPPTLDWQRNELEGIER